MAVVVSGSGRARRDIGYAPQHDCQTADIPAQNGLNEAHVQRGGHLRWLAPIVDDISHWDKLRQGDFPNIWDVSEGGLVDILRSH